MAHILDKIQLWWWYGSPKWIILMIPSQKQYELHCLMMYLVGAHYTSCTLGESLSGGEPWIQEVVPTCILLGMFFCMQLLYLPDYNYGSMDRQCSLCTHGWLLWAIILHIYITFWKLQSRFLCREVILLSKMKVDSYCHRRLQYWCPVQYAWFSCGGSNIEAFAARMLNSCL